MINKDLYLGKFYDLEEKITASNILDKVNICLRDHVNTFTNFIDMYKIGKYLEMLSSFRDINLRAFGGYPDSERNIIGLSPCYKELEESDFPIAAIEINLRNPKAYPVSHRDYLGSVLSLGIDRKKIGDILVQENKAIVFAFEEVADYILNHLTRIRNIGASAQRISLNDIKVPTPEIKEVISTVSSLRADAVLSSGFNLSRSKVVELIKAEKALINGSIAEPSSTVQCGDYLTLRGYGKIKLSEVKGKTKKGRISVVIHCYK
ncbi:MAG TPA: YlmH/Sll1252 family protein [Defluviitaleaceae bacterium]|jgi:RNA-binding protein YlmH|nr:photosystem II S4 domain protein [Candidatus Epulonipiscium sp.]HOQ17616.1 YlmH/Sll1252 family protein [Defluviitaleaceae bacterium]HPT76867.1 YlmH/Sll1252 family protein [Defluviitaleaceae bacterium]HQD50302.1 YlmH/Sll1252 family protein [Defluviitaleaceae bacterium]